MRHLRPIAALVLVYFIAKVVPVSEGLREDLQFAALVAEAQVTTFREVFIAAAVAGLGGVDADVVGAEVDLLRHELGRQIVDAEQEGVKIEYLVAPTRAVIEDGAFRGLTCIRMELGEPDAIALLQARGHAVEDDRGGHGDVHAGPAGLRGLLERLAREIDQVGERLLVLRDRELLTVRDFMEPALLARIGRFRPGPREFFTEVDYRDPVIMRTHGYHWFDLARMRDVEVIGRCHAPRQVDHPVEVVAHDRGLGRHRRHQLQLLQFSVDLDQGFLAHAGRLDRFPIFALGCERQIKRSTKLMAHDEKEEAGVGDVVKIMETRPLSKNKRWRITDVLERAK